MNKIFLCLIFMVCNYCLSAQQILNADVQTGNMMEASQDEESGEISEDDSYEQFLVDCKKNPIDLNVVNEENLAELRMLSPLQISQFMQYRKWLGDLSDIHELQAIPGWDIGSIGKIIPYVTIKNQEKFSERIVNAIKPGEHYFLFRSTGFLQKADGFIKDSISRMSAFFGSAEKISVKYKYKYKNFLQFGFVADKDAGEEFFKGSQRSGFDFYSAHIFVKNYKSLKALAIGDFTVNVGQGLLIWQGMGFKKSNEVLSVKRQSEFLKPYHSFGEINFQRGVGITIQKKSFEFSSFISFRKTDANKVIDTLASSDDYISSLQQTGLHRTLAELSDKNAQQIFSYGISLKKKFAGIKIGANYIGNRFGLPLQKDNLPYNLYSFKGTDINGASLDYEWTKNNFHLFGETAMDNYNNKAFVNGMLLSVSSKADLAFLYRNIDAGFHTFNSSAFTENSSVNNERGFYWAISFRPESRVDIRAYLDLYSFPWLKYLVDRPGGGFDYLLQMSFKPFRTTEILSRFKFERKNSNGAVNVGFITPVGFSSHCSWRTQLNMALGKAVSVRNRMEISWYESPEGLKEQGFLLFSDFIYKPMMKRFSCNMRILFFDTDSYNCRVYTYEPDMPFSYSMPVFYGSGMHYCVNLNYDMSKKISIWVKLSEYYFKSDHIGTGNDMINGSKKSEIKLQLAFKL